MTNLNNNFKWITPLWKMKISEEDYLSIKKNLKEALLSKDKIKINSMAGEAVLYYAEWWRREYNGNIPKKETLAHDLGISTEFKDALYELALKGGKDLKISFFKRTNTLWFRSLLMQGGLPINHIKSSGDNFGAYKRFLNGLINYAKTVSIDWEDLIFIRSLNCANYLPSSFQNDDIYELSLLIARAIIQEDDDLLPYDFSEDDLKEFTNELKQNVKSFSYKVPFAITWKVKKYNDYAEFYFTIECAKKISNAYIDEKGLNENNSFALYCNNKFITNYVRTINNEFIVRKKDNSYFILGNEQILNISIKTDNSRIIELTIPNCSVPDLDNPILLSKIDDNNYWEIKNVIRENSKSVIVFSDEWKVNNSRGNNSDKIKILNHFYNWQEFDYSAELENIETGETIVFDQNDTLFYHEFINWNIDWIQSANFKILTSFPSIRVYDENQERISSKKYSVLYREYRGKEWLVFENDLPIGLIEFKIVFPDNKYAKEKFFYTGELKPIYSSLDKSQGSIDWLWDNGNIFPISNQKGISISSIGDKKWKVIRDLVSSLYPEKVGFRFTTYNNSPDLDIYVATPFKGITIIDKEGVEFDTNKTISADALFAYKFMIMGFEEVETKVFHLVNNKTVLKGKVRQGINSLSRFDDEIKTINDLYGTETFDEEFIVRIVIGTGSNIKSINVRDYNVYANGISDKTCIQIVNNREEMNSVDFKGILNAVPVSCASDEIRVVQLIKNHDNYYYFDSNSELSKFIVFTDKYNNNLSLDMVVPRYFDFSEDIYTSTNVKATDISPQEVNILEIKKVLEESEAMDDEWVKVEKYFIVAVKYNLPFKTFNHLRAILRNPELIAKFNIRLSQSSSLKQIIAKEEIINAMIRMEDEFAFGWHWLDNNSHWEKAIDWYLNSYSSQIQDIIFPRLLEHIKELLDYTLSSSKEGLINGLLSENYNQEIRSPDISLVNNIRAKFDPSQNFPDRLVLIPNEWRWLFPKALNDEIPIYVRAFLFSPVKAALAYAGKDFSIWDQKAINDRRTINFYRRYNPVDYLDLFVNMVYQINNTKK